MTVTTSHRPLLALVTEAMSACRQAERALLMDVVMFLPPTEFEEAYALIELVRRRQVFDAPTLCRFEELLAVISDRINAGTSEEIEMVDHGHEYLPVTTRVLDEVATGFERARSAIRAMIAAVAAVLDHLDAERFIGGLSGA